MASYAGATCPYCGRPIGPGEQVAVCDVCGQPHHWNCWAQNRGCTTAGCARQPAAPAPAAPRVGGAKLGAPGPPPPPPGLPPRVPGASPYAAPYGAPPPYPPRAQPEESGTMGIIALVLGLVGIVFPLASIGAIICGIIGLSGRRASKALAGVGLALGFIVPAGYAVVLLPVFVTARGKAQQASCQSNLKQLELALLMYANDYDENFPAAEEWPGVTYPYLRNAQIHICPSDSRPTKQTHTYAGAPGGGVPTSYTMNRALDRGRMASVPNPAYTVSLYEGTTISGDLTSPAVRHNHGLNAGFADGHVKWFAATSFPPTEPGPSFAPSFP